MHGSVIPCACTSYWGFEPRSAEGQDRRVSPHLGSRSAAKDDPGEQARSVNLLETWGLVSRRGQRGNPLANGANSSWVAKLTVDKTVGSCLTVLGYTLGLKMIGFLPAYEGKEDNSTAIYF